MSEPRAAAAAEFKDRLAALRAALSGFPWYHTDILANVGHIARFSDGGESVFAHIGPGKAVADIGAADGDLGFFCESLGAQVTFFDWPQTNFNDCRGILETRSLLASTARLHFADLDWTTWLLGQFDLVLFLGILYHLRNPGLVLNTLAHCSERLVLSTTVFSRLDGADVSDRQLAYFLERRAINDDPTNYWVFTPAALRTLLQRSGWRVADEFCLGDADATPTTGDCRMWCHCERVPNWRDLRTHHDF